MIKYSSSDWKYGVEEIKIRYTESDDRDNEEKIMHVDKEQCILQTESNMKESSRIAKFILQN